MPRYLTSFRCLFADGIPLELAESQVPCASAWDGNDKTLVFHVTVRMASFSHHLLQRNESLISNKGTDESLLQSCTVPLLRKAEQRSLIPSAHNIPFKHITLHLLQTDSMKVQCPNGHINLKAGWRKTMTWFEDWKFPSLTSALPLPLLKC